MLTLLFVDGCVIDESMMRWCHTICSLWSPIDSC